MREFAFLFRLQEHSVLKALVLHVTHTPASPGSISLLKARSALKTAGAGKTPEQQSVVSDMVLHTSSTVGSAETDLLVTVARGGVKVFDISGFDPRAFSNSSSITMLCSFQPHYSRIVSTRSFDVDGFHMVMTAGADGAVVMTAIITEITETEVPAIQEDVGNSILPEVSGRSGKSAHSQSSVTAAEQPTTTITTTNHVARTVGVFSQGRHWQLSDITTWQGDYRPLLAVAKESSYCGEGRQSIDFDEQRGGARSRSASRGRARSGTTDVSNGKKTVASGNY